jgi:pre-mRNA-processing factor 6
MRVLRRGATSSRLFVVISYHHAALEYIPNSVCLWRETGNLKPSPTDARTLLSHTVEAVPLFCRTLACTWRPETPENNKEVLNWARKAVPTSHEIGIAAGRPIKQEVYLVDH